MRSSYQHKKKIPFYKKKQFFTVLIGVFFIMLMALSAINIGLNNEEEEQEVIVYNGLEFVYNNGWETTLSDGKVLSLTYRPDGLVNETIGSVDFGSLYYVQKLYLSSDLSTSNLGYSLYDFQNNVDTLAKVVTACYEDNEACVELPLITCEDATDKIGVVEFREANETFVTFEDNCLTIEGKNLLKVTDKLLLDYYGK
ncbi:MAG: hypothetical protein Q8Q35_04545 [Nanoarchaeota archaeon]|nr:hypothetical protein [Nanoarchaeota archaeon]